LIKGNESEQAEMNCYEESPDLKKPQIRILDIISAESSSDNIDNTFAEISPNKLFYKKTPKKEIKHLKSKSRYRQD